MSLSRAITSALSSCTRAPFWSGATTPSCSPTELRPGSTSAYTTRRWRTAGKQSAAAAAADVVAVALVVAAIAGTVVDAFVAAAGVV